MENLKNKSILDDGEWQHFFDVIEKIVSGSALLFRKNLIIQHGCDDALFANIIKKWTVHEVVFCSFDWAKSPEGLIYWAEIAEKTKPPEE